MSWSSSIASLVDGQHLHSNRGAIDSPFVLARILDLLEVLLPKVANDLYGVRILFSFPVRRIVRLTLPQEKQRIGIIIVTGGMRPYR